MFCFDNVCELTQVNASGNYFWHIVQCYWLIYSNTKLYVVMRKVSTSQSLIKWYLTNVPLDGRVWHKDVFRWVRALGCGQDASGGSKNISGPVGIPLKKGCLYKGLPWSIDRPARMPDSLLKFQTVYWKASACSSGWSRYLSLPSTRQDLTQSQWTEGRL